MEKILNAIDAYNNMNHHHENEKQALKNFNIALLSFISEKFPLIIVDSYDIFLRSVIMLSEYGEETYTPEATFSRKFIEKMNTFYPEHCI